MASLSVFTFDHEGCPIQFDTWLDDLQLYLLSDSEDNVSLFDHTSGASIAPPATADSATRSQWLSRDATARLAVRNHLPLAERAHFGQHISAKALYDAVVACYSFPATAALGRLLLPYLFPELSAFATVEDLVSHLRTSDAGYRSALSAEFLDRNPPPMYITLYFTVTRLPDSLRAIRDHFLTLDPTDLNVDLLEQHLLVAETSVVVVGAAHGTPRTPFFEGCSPSPLAPSYASAVAVDILGTMDVGAASALKAAALGASESALPGTAPAEALHTFTLDSGASRCFFRDSLCLPSRPRLPPPCLPCVERTAPHSSLFPPTSALLQTLHKDVWGPARVSGQGRERYFLLVVDDYTRYTTVIPLRSKGEIPGVLIRWIRTVRLQLRERFRQDLPILHLHSDRGGEFSSDLLRDILQSWGGHSPVVARTSMIHAAAPHFLWPFAVWGSRAFVCDTSADKLSARAIPCGHAPSGVSQVDPLPGTVPVEVVVDSGAARGLVSGGEEPGGTEPVGAELEGAEPRGAEREGAELGGAESEGAESGGAGPRGTASTGGPAGASPRLSPRPEPLSPQQLREWFAWCTRLRSRAAGAGDSAAGGTGAGGAGGTSLGGAGVLAGVGGHVGAGAAGPGAGDGDHRAGGAGAGGTGAGSAGAGGARGGDTDVGGTRAVALGAGGACAGGAASCGTGASGNVNRCPFFVPPSPSSLPPPDSVLRQVLSLPSSTCLHPCLLSPQPRHSQPQLQPDSPLPAPSPYAEQTDSFAESREPETRPDSPVRAVCAGRHVPRPRPPPVPGTHVMALPPSSVPLRVPLPPPPESSLPAVPDLARAASPTVIRLLASVVTDPSFESIATSALVAELVDFAAACRLNNATSLVADSEFDCPPSVGVKCAHCTEVFEDRHEDFECLAAAVPHLVAMLLTPEGDPDAPDIPTLRSYAEAIMGPYSFQWQTTMDAEMASWKSTGTYVDVVPPSGANIVDGMWIFIVKRPSSSPPVFKARYVARGFSQRQGVDFFHTFSSTLKMTTLWVLLHVAAQYDYELHSLHFSTAFLQGSLHEEITLRLPPGFTGSFPAGTQWSL
ncbi:unnamed protein product [Closterium sp. NIES-54]